jgi:hypothetical protein
MELQKQDSVGCGGRRPRSKSGTLIRVVHDAEAIKDDVGGFGCQEATFCKQWQPGAAVRAAELTNGSAAQPTGTGDTLHRVSGLIPQDLRFDASRFVRHRVIVGELGQAACRAESHRKRMGRLVGAHRLACRGEVVRCRDISDVQDATQFYASTSAARAHDKIDPCGSNKLSSRA